MYHFFGMYLSVFNCGYVLLEITKFHLHKSLPGAGIIRKKGIIRRKALYEEIRYFKKLNYLK